jgi:hypothetical protein
LGNKAIAGDHGAVERHAVHEVEEGLLDVVHIAVAVEVLAIDVRHDRDDGRKLEKGAVTLVGFGDHVLRASVASIRAERVHATADHDRRIEIAGLQDRRDHRRRRGLAMHARDGDAVL